MDMLTRYGMVLCPRCAYHSLYCTHVGKEKVYCPPPSILEKGGEYVDRVWD